MREVGCPWDAEAANFPQSRVGSGVEERVDERLGLERRQVVGALAQADQLDRDAELTLHRITMPPLAVPSSLVSTMPVTSTTSAKMRACVSPF